MGVDMDSGAIGADPTGKEVLGVGRVAEHVEDAWRSGEWLSSKGLLDPCRQFGLLIKLLKCAIGGNDPVAERLSCQVASVPNQPGGYHEQPLGERPSGPQSLHAFGLILDDVDDVAEVNHVGGTPFGRPVSRIPTICGEAQIGQMLQVVAAAASVVE